MNRTIILASLAWIVAVGIVGLFIGAPVATCFGGAGLCSSVNEQIRQGYWWWPWLPMIAGPTAIALWSAVRGRGRQH
ncbi:MAG: hypothetical protein M3082_06580 [Candidatus Dormibacteraeota bacterium]|nr:hypothetical protein [Candidatus Dormibacteraeota bacterium]